ncbi:plasmid mobilization protein [Cupriavidus sp. 30B13]|uniref:plasmid mobilization protein n=1 Tax=Cupriavidus sp. 30B13 TaxID=3384241 RepID=UPI003B90F200
MRNKFIKVRVAPAEYAGIARHADAAGQTMSEYVREQVLAVHRTLDLQAELAALRGLVAAPARSTNDALALEAVLLLRELAAARDAQILGRVRAQLAQRTAQQGGQA